MPGQVAAAALPPATAPPGTGAPTTTAPVARGGGRPNRRQQREQQAQLAANAVGGEAGEDGEPPRQRTRRNVDQVDVLDQMSLFYGQQLRNTSKLIENLNSQQVVGKLQSALTSAIEIRAQKQRSGLDCTRDDALINAMQLKLEQELNAQFGIQL